MKAVVMIVNITTQSEVTNECDMSVDEIQSSIPYTVEQDALTGDFAQAADKRKSGS